MNESQRGSARIRKAPFRPLYRRRMRSFEGALAIFQTDSLGSSANFVLTAFSEVRLAGSGY